MALVLSVAIASFGQTGILLGVVLMTGITALFAASAKRTALICLGVLALGLSPFFLGLDLNAPGLFPKIFYDELPLILLVGLGAVDLLQGQHPAPQPKYWVWPGIGLLALTLPLLFNDLTYVAVRTYLETAVFGYLLYFIMLLETPEAKAEAICTALVVMTVALSLLGLAEYVLKQNPVLENAVQDGVVGFTYFSPKLMSQLKASYRPYITFFHPSEAGTFVAMGLPFVLRAARSMTRKALGAVLVCLVLACIIVDFTRGVWVALIIAGLIFYPKIRPWVLLAGILAIGGMAIMTTAAPDSPFLKRMFDPTNLYIRFFYWKVGLNVFADNFLFGVGYMNFKQVYLSYVGTVSPELLTEIGKIFVADNFLLTVAIEHGVVGLIGLALLFGLPAAFVWRGLRGQGLTWNSAKDTMPVAVLMALVIYLASGLLVDVHDFAKATKLYFILAGFGVALMHAKRPVS
jgi:O-antigen ligase